MKNIINPLEPTNYTILYELKQTQYMITALKFIELLSKDALDNSNAVYSYTIADNTNVINSSYTIIMKGTDATYIFTKYSFIS